MKRLHRLLFTTIFLSGLITSVKSQEWKISVNKQFDIYYTNCDSTFIEEYKQLLEHGIQTIETTFDETFPDPLDIYVHPDRAALNKQWQKDWNMPEFESQCWMVASGTSEKIDLLSPVSWKKDACEHNYHNKEKTQKLITHELVHVFHGQHNVSPDFTETYGINWFIEGLATYTSGQCDSSRISDVKMAINKNQNPEALDNFWSGNLRYGFCGTLVMFLDDKYGYKTLFTLLTFNKKSEILNTLKITEDELIKEWKEYITQKL